jgi:hypothetical protein
VTDPTCVCGGRKLETGAFASSVPAQAEWACDTCARKGWYFVGRRGERFDTMESAQLSLRRPGVHPESPP